MKKMMSLFMVVAFSLSAAGFAFAVNEPPVVSDENAPGVEEVSLAPAAEKDVKVEKAEKIEKDEKVQKAEKPDKKVRKSMKAKSLKSAGKKKKGISTAAAKQPVRK